MTLIEAKAICRDYGCILTKVDGEYRVNYRGGYEPTAYYTTDIQDAVDTARAMAVAKVIKGD